jgi:regulator of sigma E protease
MLEALYIVIALGLTILVHELGHFLTAKALGIRVEAFSIGFGPEIVSWKRGETEYRIGWLLFLGGYVKLGGEDPDKVDAKDKKAFLNQHPAKKILAVSAGVVQNLIFSFVLVWIVFIAGTEVQKPVIGYVAENYPAALAGMKPGDEITAVNGREISYWRELNSLIEKEGANEMTFGLRRGGKDLTVKVTPRIEEKTDILKDKKMKPVVGIQSLPYLNEIEALEKGYPAYDSGLKPGDIITAVNGKKTAYWDGVSDGIEKSSGEAVFEVLRNGQKLEYRVATVEKEYFNSASGKKEKIRVAGIRPRSNSVVERYGPIAAVPKAIEQVNEFIALTVKSVYKMIMRKIEPDVAGPLGVIQISYEVAKTGIIPLLFLFAIININLALMNFLPVPPLDGGLVLIFLIEWVTGKQVPLKVQEALMQIGWFLLISLIVFVTYKDILRFIKGG